MTSFSGCFSGKLLFLKMANRGLGYSHKCAVKSGIEFLAVLGIVKSPIIFSLQIEFSKRSHSKDPTACPKLVVMRGLSLAAGTAAPQGARAAVRARRGQGPAAAGPSCHEPPCQISPAHSSLLRYSSLLVVLN